MKILKIKADKMRELAKFGFEEAFGLYCFAFGIGNALSVNKKTKILYLFESDVVPSVVYDLIKAGMVEKVEE